MSYAWISVKSIFPYSVIFPMFSNFFLWITFLQLYLDFNSHSLWWQLVTHPVFFLCHSQKRHRHIWFSNIQGLVAFYFLSLYIYRLNFLFLSLVFKSFVYMSIVVYIIPSRNIHSPICISAPCTYIFLLTYSWFTMLW